MSITQIGAVGPSYAAEIEFAAIAAAVLGGVSLFGGRGGVVGTVFGAILIKTVQNGLNVVNADPYVYPARDRRDHLRRRRHRRAAHAHHRAHGAAPDPPRGGRMSAPPVLRAPGVRAPATMPLRVIATAGGRAGPSRRAGAHPPGRGEPVADGPGAVVHGVTEASRRPRQVLGAGAWRMPLVLGRREARP